MQASEISLILVLVFVIYCILFWNVDNFTNNEEFDLYDDIGIPAPV
jgi:hypothetical protein